MSGANMSESSEVLVSREGAIVTLTINRPRAKNSLNRAVFDGLRAQLAQLRDDDAVRAVIITGAEGVFCAGADITAFEVLRAARRSARRGRASTGPRPARCTLTKRSARSPQATVNRSSSTVPGAPRPSAGTASSTLIRAPRWSNHAPGQGV